MKLTPKQLFDLRKQYQDAKEAREYYREDLEWFNYYEGVINGIEWTLRSLDLSFDDFSTIVRPDEK